MPVLYQSIAASCSSAPRKALGFPSTLLMMGLTNMVAYVLLQITVIDWMLMDVCSSPGAYSHSQEQFSGGLYKIIER